MMGRKRCRAHGDIKCECGGLIHTCGCFRAPLFVVIGCIHKGSPDELFEELVNAACSFAAEDPVRLTWALDRIAKAKRMRVNDVTLEMIARVQERTGTRRLPGQALSIVDGRARLDTGN